MPIGLYIIGDEILSGRRQDKHLSQVIQLLKSRGLNLSWVRILGDDLTLLAQHFRSSLATDDWVFSTGGIGGTPDDLTRQAVAIAAGVELQPHTEGLQLLQQHLDGELTPLRQRMIEFPVGAELIPNPVNGIPGFSLQRHYCVPGFPQMAWPMLEWVLDHCYLTENQTTPVELALQVLDTPESRLIPLMEAVLERFADVKVFSLPTLGEQRLVELGVTGPESEAQDAMRLIRQELQRIDVKWREFESR